MPLEHFLDQLPDFPLWDGKQQEIGFEEVVVDDILPLLSGSRIPADACLVSSAGFIVSEVALTGESAPVHKQADAEVAAEAPLVERTTAVFAGTTWRESGYPLEL
jgi:P-type E1-E2 ATPase